MAYPNPTLEALALAQINFEDYDISFPSWNREIKDVQARNIFSSIVRSAWTIDAGVFHFHLDTARSIRVARQDLLVAWEESLSYQQIDRAISILSKEKWLDLEGRLTPDAVVVMLRNKHPQNILGCIRRCSWCKGATYLLQEHHYPIPKSQGGKEIVRICPNCHYEFHHLLRQRLYRLTDKAIGLCLNSSR